MSTWHPEDVYTGFYTSLSDDGVTWKTMARPTWQYTPAKDCEIQLYANAAVMADAGGVSVQMGLYVSGGIYPTVAATPEHMGEFGMPGAFIPQGVALSKRLPLKAGVTYTFSMRFKAQTAAAANGKTLYVGLGGAYQPILLFGVPDYS